MAKEYIEATSESVQKRSRLVKKVTGKMGFDSNMDKANWKVIRKLLSLSNQMMPKASEVIFRKMKSDKIKAIISEPEKVNEDHVIMYIHGGGFVSGSAASSRSYTSALAKKSGCRVIAIDYALAPENPAPAAFNDCCDAFTEIVSHHPNAKISLVGDSAGANLSLALALKMKNTGKIASVSVHSPMIDFSDSMDRSQHPIEDFIIQQGCLQPLVRMYVKENDLRSPYISPYYGDFENFPPTFITCDTNETLYADAVALYDLCEKAGVDVDLIEVRGTFHDFGTIGIGTKEANWILKQNVEFIHKYAK